MKSKNKTCISAGLVSLALLLPGFSFGLDVTLAPAPSGDGGALRMEISGEGTPMQEWILATDDGEGGVVFLACSPKSFGFEESDADIRSFRWKGDCFPLFGGRAFPAGYREDMDPSSLGLGGIVSTAGIVFLVTSAMFFPPFFSAGFFVPLALAGSMVAFIYGGRLGPRSMFAKFEVALAWKHSPALQGEAALVGFDTPGERDAFAETLGYLLAAAEAERNPPDFAPEAAYP